MSLFKPSIETTGDQVTKTFSHQRLIDYLVVDDGWWSRCVGDRFEMLTDFFANIIILPPKTKIPNARQFGSDLEI